jgi:3'-phosphoadenosine 5'-phosphosulfate sulfotransferase (PAPS reductase)/FAD synthetase
MQKVLGKKQSIRNDDWISAYSRIEELVPMEELDKLIKSTVGQIRELARDKKAAYAWSAGKDSIVLGKICEMAGISDCMLAVSNLEYPAFMEWIEQNRPDGLSVINTGQDIRWLEKHQDMLFPQESKTAANWFKIVQHRAQEKYYKEHQLDMVILGRRKADGNYVGRGSNIYTNAKGICRYSPLADWPHEAILAFIHYYQLPLPPIYDWKNGYLCGTHPWPARQWTGSISNGWREIYEIDPSIVEAAAEIIPSAREFLDNDLKEQAICR